MQKEKIGFFENNDKSKSFKNLSGFLVLIFDMIILSYCCIKNIDIPSNCLILLSAMNAILPFIYKFQTNENLLTKNINKNE